MLKTTHTSLDAHKGIPRNNLLKTFQDVVIITRKLSIRYLWIDSLCIIQQDQSDRETEAAKMALSMERRILLLQRQLLRMDRMDTYLGG
jgi:hypothetical protein